MVINLESFTAGTTAAAIAALGTAACAIVDGLKTLPVIGVSNAGYVFIERAIAPFMGAPTRRSASGLVRTFFDDLHGNWINGRALEEQKAIAKSLIKLRLTPATAVAFADSTGVDPALLAAAATRMASDVALEQSDAGVLNRFDSILNAILDDAYQHADQRYRNWAKVAAASVAVVLSFCGGFAADCSAGRPFLGTADMALTVLAGLLAAPLAPVTKDLASALQAGVRIAQAVRV